jgi:hypothetical protein
MKGFTRVVANLKVPELYLNSRVKEAICRRAKTKARVAKLSGEVASAIDADLNSFASRDRMASDLEFENKKLETAQEKEKKKREEEEQESKKVNVTTVLLVFKRGGRRKKQNEEAELPVAPEDKEQAKKNRRANREFAVILFTDGPDVVPYKQFKEDSIYSVREYWSAVDRGSAEGVGCERCEKGHFGIVAHKAHVAWHAKFRKFLGLRKTINLTDEMSLTVKDEQNSIAQLVDLWRQVDAAAPYFSLPQSHWKHSEEKVAAVANKKKNTRRASGGKGRKKPTTKRSYNAAGRIGSRIPREMNKK